MIRTKEELYEDVPVYIKSNGSTSISKTTGSSLKTMLINIIDSMSMDGVPRGLIAMWSGLIADIPAGWRLCNGVDGAPDLRDKFVVGAGGLYSVRQTLGSNSHTHLSSISGTAITIGQMPYHSFFTVNTKTGGIGTGEVPNSPAYSVSWKRVGADGSNNSNLNYALSGDLEEPTRGKTNSIGEGKTHTHTINLLPESNIPESMALAFIQYVGLNIINDGTPPTPPAPTKLTPTSTGFTISWGESFSSYGIFSYRISLDDDVILEVPNMLPSFDARLASIFVDKIPGVTYYVGVQAVDMFENLSSIVYTSYTIPLPLPLISDFSLSKKYPNALDLKFKLDAVEGLNSVEIFMSETLNGIYLLISDEWPLPLHPVLNGYYEYKLEDLASSTPYYFKARVKMNNDVRGPYTSKLITSTRLPEVINTTTATLPPSDPHCPVKGTMVTLLDGTETEVENLKEGDQLMSGKIDTFIDSQDEEVFTWSNSKLRVRPASATVKSITKEFSNNIVSINDGLVEVSESHTHLIRRGEFWKFVSAKNVKEGDYIHSTSGHLLVTKVEFKTDKTEVYKLVLNAPNHLFYANGVLTHNPVDPETDEKIREVL